jgi:hypothetical protein
MTAIAETKHLRSLIKSAATETVTSFSTIKTERRLKSITVLPLILDSVLDNIHRNRTSHNLFLRIVRGAAVEINIILTNHRFTFRIPTIHDHNLQLL